MNRRILSTSLALAVTVISLSSFAGDYRRTNGVIWGADADVQIPLGGDLPRNHVDNFEDFWGLTGSSMQFGYRLGSTEISVRGHFIADQLGGFGLLAMYRMPFTDLLLVGGGLGMVWSDRNAGLRFALPRVELRLPISASWEFAWTIAELSYVDTLLTDDSDDDYWYDGYRELFLTTSIGVRARVNRVWEREPPPPMSNSVLIRVNHIFGLMGVTAEERSDPDVVGPDEDAEGGRFPTDMFMALEAMVGYRLDTEPGYLDLGVPVTFYALQFKVAAGVAATWRFKKLSWLGIGAAVSYYPKKYILVELPRLELTYRPLETFEIFIKPIGFMFLVEPARDVWVEEGFESKVPNWGINFGIGLGWAAPTG